MMISYKTLSVDFTKYLSSGEIPRHLGTKNLGNTCFLSASYDLMRPLFNSMGYTNLSETSAHFGFSDCSDLSSFFESYKVFDKTLLKSDYSGKILKALLKSNYSRSILKAFVFLYLADPGSSQFREEVFRYFFEDLKNLDVLQVSDYGHIIQHDPQEFWNGILNKLLADDHRNYTQLEKDSLIGLQGVRLASKLNSNQLTLRRDVGQPEKQVFLTYCFDRSDDFQSKDNFLEDDGEIKRFSKDLNSLQRHVTLIKFPDSNKPVIVHIKRFYYSKESNQTVKRENEIKNINIKNGRIILDFPYEKISENSPELSVVSRFEVSEYKYRININHVVLHSGSANFGHYTKAVFQDKKWYYVDDDNVSIVNIEQIFSRIKTDGYLFGGTIL